MLLELHISRLGVIEDLELELHPGLNVLTGETGAGKTMVTMGLALALGGRASGARVRRGGGRARVEARFTAPAVPSVAEWTEDGEVVLARTVAEDGKSSARIGGQIVPVSALAAIGPELVEVHGQGQHQRLLSSATQTELLDRFVKGAHVRTVRQYAQAFDRGRRLRLRLQELEREAREREREKDLLAYQVREIEGAALRPGEMTELAAEEGRLAHAERLTELAGAAQEALGGEGAAVDGLHAARAALRDAGSIDPEGADLSRRAEGLAAEAAELARDVRDWREGVRADPQRLQEVSDRLLALRALERKYGDGERGVLAFLDQARDRLLSLAGTDRELEALGREAAEAEALAQRLARAISAGRERAAPALASALQGELRELGMEGAAIQVRLCALAEPDPSGNERAELVLSGAPGQPPLPLARSASGGELSRVMLAARTVMADLDSLPTLVFDEIDAGIGGMAGAAVGRRLALLATCKQVLVVTHLPQIACFADRHVAVTKENGVAGIRVLEGDERIIEIARMLSGRSDSASAISHARELLDKAWETTRRLGAARPPSPPARAAATPVRGGARTT